MAWRKDDRECSPANRKGCTVRATDTGGLLQYRARLGVTDVFLPLRPEVRAQDEHFYPIKLDHGVDNLAMAISLVASTRGLALMPAYARDLLPWSVVSRPLEGAAPTIDLAVGYSKANSSPILKLFLSRLGELRANTPAQKH
jgi:DNA-binding transcriptional LysR family regulator